MSVFPEPGEKTQPVFGKPVGVLAGAESAATELLHLQEPSLPPPDPFGGEVEDRIGDGELGHGRDLGILVLAHPQARDRERPQPRGKLVEEPTEVTAAGSERLQSLEAVDHNQPWAAFSDRAAELLGNSVKP